MAEVDILIGLDYYYDFIGPEEMRSATGVVLLRSPLGYVTSGFVRQHHGSSNSLLISSMPSQLLIIPPPMHVRDSIERFWDIEEIGIKDVPGQKDDEIALQYFNDTITQNSSGRYEVRLPFKVRYPDLANTYQLAYGRLRTQVNRFRQDPQVMSKICQTFEDQIEAGIIELAPNSPQGVEYYMPHHCVFNPERETTKIHVVFDASAKTSKESQSLNDSVYRGPVFLQDLVGIIMRLRMSPVVISADIAKVFHQVSLAPEHRDSTRFLWLKDITKPFSRDNLDIYRFARVPFGINASPFLLAGTLIHHLRRVGGKTAEDILSNLYVDDVFAGVSSTNEALKFYSESKSIFESAFMNLRQFYSNDHDFISSISEKDRGSLSSAKILGVQWNNLNDTLSAHVGSGLHKEGKTKRTVLSALASIYDPCGWLSPVSIRAKLLMQEIWKRGSDWDSELPSDIIASWKNIQADLCQIESVEIPRFHFCTGPLSYEIHAFSDASTKAYAGVVYLLVKSPTKIACLLLFGKARVAPLRDMTVPRLELMGAWITAKLIRFVSEQLQVTISRKVLWTDSMCVHGWITNINRQATTAFVRNRVKDIQQFDMEIRYVPSADNPADMASRGTTVKDLKAKSLWWKGPEWLHDKNLWPNPGKCSLEITEAVKENHTMTAISKTPPELVIDATRFSSITKLLRVTCLVFRVVRRKSNDRFCAISATEMQEATNFWNSYIQEKFLSQLLASARSKKLVPYSNLSVYLTEDNLLRCKGRFQNSNLPYNAKHPILLPRSNPFTFLVIMDCHERLFHSGVNHTLSALRSKYWIPHGRSEVKSVLRECKLCRKLRGGHFRVPEPPPLPAFRVVPKRPFECVGLDYLGPLMVSSVVGDKKVWIALFTCSTTRALYVDVVDSLSTSDFLLCLRRFVALYGLPKLICSDNARQFHMADRVIKKGWKSILESDEVYSYSSTKGITWKFTTDLAPWMGGFYERLVGPVKQCLRVMLGRKKVSTEDLQTLVFETASVLNSRPLFHSGTEVDDFPITPSHLLFKSNSQFPTFEVEETYLPTPNTRTEDAFAQWAVGQKLLDGFWHHWQNQYLLGLRQQKSWYHQRNTQDLGPKIGGMVLIKDNLPRGRWKYGKITELRESSDGKIRSAVVLIPSGNTLIRPLRLLYPLESPEYAERPPKPKLPQNSSAQQPARTASKRASAVRAKEKIRVQLSEEESFGC